MPNFFAKYSFILKFIQIDKNFKKRLYFSKRSVIIHQDGEKPTRQLNFGGHYGKLNR